jgi:hypothetical protein
VSKVVPIAKISDLLEPKGYRPVSILKALEIVMQDQIVVNIESARVLNSFQSALLNIFDDIYRLLDQRFLLV